MGELGTMSRVKLDGAQLRHSSLGVQDGMPGTRECTCLHRKHAHLDVHQLGYLAEMLELLPGHGTSTELHAQGGLMNVCDIADGVVAFQNLLAVQPENYA